MQKTAPRRGETIAHGKIFHEKKQRLKNLRDCPFTSCKTVSLNKLGPHVSLNGVTGEAARRIKVKPNYQLCAV
jgi:hypothetical protein